MDECEIESIGEVVPTPVVMDDIDFSKASDDIVENAAEQGVVKAQIELSDRYYDKNNYRKAFEWAKKAAESGEPEAQATLATYYKLSIGTCEYPQKVFELHMQAAEQGYAESQYAVGELYYSGYSVQKNIDIAFQWFEKAANQGHQDALFVLATVDDFNNRISNQKRRKILEQLVDQNHEDAAVVLGFYYMNGNHVQVDYDKAFRLFCNEIVKWGNSDARYGLGLMYFHGLGRKKNKSEGLRLITEAADNSLKPSEYACDWLAEYYGEESLSSIAKDVALGGLTGATFGLFPLLTGRKFSDIFGGDNKRDKKKAEYYKKRAAEIRSKQK